MWIMAAASAASVAESAYSGHKAYEAQKDAQRKQEQALEEAKAEQERADFEAERNRLESLAQAQTATSASGVDFGDVDITSKYLDENTKRQRKAQQLIDEDENPFYEQGLF